MKVDMKALTQKNSYMGHGCSKTILVGEHAVVYGAKAIAIPLKQMRTQIYITPHDENRIEFINVEISKQVTPVIEEAFELLNSKFEKVKVSGYSTIPIGSGLGSSASLCVSLIKVISNFLKIDIDDNNVSMLANELEKQFHGTPSGIDTTVIAKEEIVLFRKGEAPTSLNIAGEPFLDFAVINSNIKACTDQMIRKAKPFFTGDFSKENIQTFDQITSDVILALQKRDSHTIARAMNQCHELLRMANVSIETIDNMIQYSLQIGCLASKITGAGGGGCVLSLLDKEQKNDQIKQLKEKFGETNVYEVKL